MIGVQLQAQSIQDSSIVKKPIDKSIDNYVLTVKNRKYRRLLVDFAKDRDSLTHMSVERETSTFFEIWVDFRTVDGYNLGEGYTLDKETGNVEMIWHEQPFQAGMVICFKAQISRT